MMKILGSVIMCSSLCWLLAILLAGGVLWVWPCLGSFHHSCSDQRHNGCCDVGRPVIPVFVNVAQAQSGEPKAPPKKPPLSNEAKAALEKLIEGNRRFVAGKPLNKHTSLKWRAKTAKEQKPFSPILGGV